MVKDGNDLLNWLNFFKTWTREEFDAVAATNPEIRKAVDILYEISADEKVRAEYNARQKAWMDRQSQFDGYFKKGKAEGKAEGKVETARNALAEGLSIDIISKITGLTLEEIAKL